VGWRVWEGGRHVKKQNHTQFNYFIKDSTNVPSFDKTFILHATYRECFMSPRLSQRKFRSAQNCEKELGTTGTKCFVSRSLSN